MHKGLGFFAGGLASLAMLGGAQAKMVRYEINGQRYSYNTNNREQVEEARRRIAAANAAYAAWLKAEAERASNPLARVLGRALVTHALTRRAPSGTSINLPLRYASAAPRNRTATAALWRSISRKTTCRRASAFAIMRSMRSTSSVSGESVWP